MHVQRSSLVSFALVAGCWLLVGTAMFGLVPGGWSWHHVVICEGPSRTDALTSLRQIHYSQSAAYAMGL